MTALTQDRDTQPKDGSLGAGKAGGGELLYGGAAICFDADGYLVEGADTAGLVFAGINASQIDNADGSDGDLNVEFWRDKLHLMVMGTAITRANVGDKVYLVDDKTVDLAGNVTNRIFCGVIAEYVSTALAYIDITTATKQTDVASHISDPSAAHAASAVSIADAGGFTAQTTVEAGMQEMYPHIPAAISDPGDAGAIPVTRSGNCALTTAGAETRTLAIPSKVGTSLAVTLDVDGGDCVITAAAAINQTGNNTITLGDAGDTIVLEGVQVGGALVWRVIVNDGCALSTV